MSLLKQNKRAIGFILAYAALFAYPASGGEVFLDNRLGAILPKEARWALEAIDLDTGKNMISAGNAINEPMIPGSLVKLFTAGAALDYAETHGRFDMTTYVFYDGNIVADTLKGNIYIVGRGNAFLSGKDLDIAVKGFLKAGIKKINGDVFADDTLFDTKGLERTRKGPGHASAGALGIDLHTAAVYVMPSEQGKEPFVSIEPQNDNVRFSVSARTGGFDKIEIIRMDDTSYRITGSIPADSAGVKKRFELKDPALYAAGVLKTLLEKSGIDVKGSVKKGAISENAKEFVKIKGPDIYALIKDMNVNSLNVTADNLLLLLGEERYGAPGTDEKGIKVLKEFLSALGLKPEDIKICDGSGLKQCNMITSRFMAEYLNSISKKSWFNRFQDSLPSTGEGTLKNIGFDAPLFRIKTGNLEDAFALSGYGTDSGGRNISFSYIVNVAGAGITGLNGGSEVLRYLAGGVR